MKRVPESLEWGLYASGLGATAELGSLVHLGEGQSPRTGYWDVSKPCFSAQGFLCGHLALSRSMAAVAFHPSTSASNVSPPFPPSEAICSFLSVVSTCAVCHAGRNVAVLPHPAPHLHGSSAGTWVTRWSQVGPRSVGWSVGLSLFSLLFFSFLFELAL